MCLVSLIRRCATLVLTIVALAAGCRDAEPLEPGVGTLTLSPATLAFTPGRAGVGERLRVPATTTGLGASPGFRWVSLNTTAIEVDSVLEGGAVAVLRNVAPGGAFVAVVAIGSGKQVLGVVTKPAP